ncbi:unnamed protein product [Dracunculus medinensis]|uniref:Pseudouridylate synthase 1 homolog n=1 Tax=Dracunculus medinensis TaxID=318479 RepID=A0A0N4UDE5_DRAME|nr:unnamed protein product [Dracunculus medinensis]
MIRLISEKPISKKSAKRIRYAILLAYRGQNYFGMQLQKEYPTVEGCLLKALLENNFISKEEYKDPFLCYFQRASRTDRSVSAVRQVCTIKMPKNNNFITNGSDILNMKLPLDIRIFGIRRTTPSFHPQKSCFARTYSYTLPTFAFAKSNELTSAAFRITDETINEISSVLQIFVGTHNFFNYTSKKQYDEKSCCRFIHSFKCGPKRLFRDEIRNEDVEFITIFIKGQSFMLHQIRKMIGMVIAVCRGFAYKSDIQKSFENARLDLPKAPGLGLVLERLHYDYYDKKFANLHGSLSYWGDTIENAVEDMRECIISDILKKEVTTYNMLSWISSLINHDFSENDDSAIPPLAIAGGIALGKITVVQNSMKR